MMARGRDRELYLHGAPLLLPSDQDASGRSLGTEELARLRAVIESGTLTATKGVQTPELERRATELTGALHAIACSSGSAAIHAAVAALDPEPGDEIVTTAITDMGALAPILAQGAIPRFADVDATTGMVTAATVEAALSARTCAVVVTHLFGLPARIDEIVALADARGIPVVEDCAQAFRARRAGRPVGSFGAIACFSTQQGKHITTGEGGLVLTDSDVLARRARMFVNKAWPYGEADPDHEFLAPNYRTTELQSAVANAQLDKLDAGVARRQATVARFATAIAGLTGVAFPNLTSDDVATYWKVPLLVDPSVPGGPRAVAAALAARGVAERAALHPEAGLRVSCVHRAEDVRHEPVAVPARRHGRARLLADAIPRHLRIPRPRDRAALERALRGRARGRGRGCGRGRGARAECHRMTVRFGIVGAGGIARSYLQVFSGLAGAELVAVADVDPAATAAVARGTGATAHTDVDDLLAHADVDAVVVCTPPNVHPEVALAAIRAGVAVLCEKPLAIGVDAARHMVSAATLASVQFTMATKFRFVDAVVEARRLVESGVLGELIHVENVFASRVDMTQRWNSDRAVSGGGVLIDSGTHSVDVARHFLGPIRDALVVEAPRTQSLDVEDSVQLLLRADTDATATIDLSWSYDNVDDDYLRVYGSEGALRIGWRRSEYRTNADAEWRGFASRYDKVRCMRAQVSNFCGALEGREVLAVSAADAIASVQVIDAGYRSMALGDWAPVEPTRRVQAAGGDIP